MPGSYYIQYRCDGIASYLKIFDASTNAQLYSGSAIGGPSASDTSWTQSFPQNNYDSDISLQVAGIETVNATISITNFQDDPSVLVFDASSLLKTYGDFGVEYNADGVFAYQIVDGEGGNSGGSNTGTPRYYIVYKRPNGDLSQPTLMLYTDTNGTPETTGTHITTFEFATIEVLVDSPNFGSNTSWTDNFDMNGGLVTVSNAGSSNATISFEYHGQTLTFDTSAYVFNSSNGYYNTAGAFAPQIIPSPTIQAFANIQLNATPTADNHLVTKSYVTNNYLGVSSVAPAWASNNDYAYGDLVIYEGKLYRCTTEYNNNTPSSLNGWEAAKLTDTATSSFYGLVKPGTGIGVSNGTVSLNAATTSSLGGVIVGDGLTVSSGTISVSWGRKKAQATTSGTVYLRDNVGTYIVRPSSNITISFNQTNLTTSSGYSIEFTLVLVEQSTLRTITLPNTITWLGTQPTFDTTNTAYIIDIFSYNGGTNWFASYRGTMPSSAVTLN